MENASTPTLPSHGAAAFAANSLRMSRRAGTPPHGQRPKFVSTAVRTWCGSRAEGVRKWCEQSGAGVLCLDSGTPWQNGIVKTCNGRLRDELFSVVTFTALPGLRRLGTACAAAPSGLAGGLPSPTLTRGGRLGATWSAPGIISSHVVQCFPSGRGSPCLGAVHGRWCPVARGVQSAGG